MGLNSPRWEISFKEPVRSVPDVVRVLLENRGIEGSSLQQSLKDLESHLCILGLEEGAELMARHLRAGHKIVLTGDYDCDGVTSVAQMALFLRDIGYSNFEVIIPSRSEGYGIPMRAVKEHSDASLFVALDCGTQDVEPISMAVEMGADCIVIDHHEVPLKGVAPATVLINPKQATCTSLYKEFCSSGLTLLFLAKLRRALGESAREISLGGKYLALASIGTVADLVPLTSGNRILTQYGLKSINARSYPPLEQIALSAGLAGKVVTSGHLGYYIGPRINAAGRMAEATIAFELLLCERPEDIARLAQDLNRLNVQRQEEENRILETIRIRILRDDPGRRTVVLGDKDWAAGVIGIVASKVQQELHYGPTVILSFDEEAGLARGSARSIPGFDIHKALKACEDVLVRWGGHKMAAGMTISLNRVDEFAERFEAVAWEWRPEVFIPRRQVDMILDLSLVSKSLCEALKELEPHGLGNPAPTFGAAGVHIEGFKTFGKDRAHLRLRANGVQAICWRGAKRLENLREGQRLDLVFQLEWDSYSNGPLLNIKDLGEFF
jgi:single-stranded-DNA-specific exonuclease